MLTIKNARKSFYINTPMQNSVLNGLDLHINEGEFVSIIGTNGAGKSTLLNAVCGVVMLDAGQILLDDKDVTRTPAHKRTKDIARVFQDPMAGTCEALSIEENLAIAYYRGQGRTLLRAITPKMRKLFRQKLAMLNLGLENRLQDLVGQLSGGQRQALSLLMASLTPSRVLLLDEHTAALDPKTAKFVLTLSDSIIKDNKLTALMVTHSMQQAIDFGSRVVMLDKGRVCLDIDKHSAPNMTVADLLAQFHKKHTALDDDRLMLS